MRIFFVVLFYALILTGVAFISFKTIKNIHLDKRKKEVLNSFVRMQAFLGIEDAVISSETTLLIYFNSECDYCRKEIEDISKNIEMISEVRILFISHESREQGLHFLKSLNLFGYPYVDLLDADPEKILDLLGGRVPQTLIYKKGILRHHYSGQTGFSKVLKNLNSEEIF